MSVKRFIADYLTIGERVVLASDHERTEELLRRVVDTLDIAHKHEYNVWMLGHTHVGQDFDEGCSTCQIIAEASTHLEEEA